MFKECNFITKFIKVFSYFLVLTKSKIRIENTIKSIQQLEALTTNYLIKDSPAAVAILDLNLKFICHSDMWLKEFEIEETDIIGKHYYDVNPNLPDALKQIHQDCLGGKTSTSKGEKFVHEDGHVQWLKWKINPWKDHQNNIGGLIIVKEDITERKREEELLLIAEGVARIGGWEVDLINNKVYWTSITKEIHEVGEDYVPNLEEGINFYKAGASRKMITALVADAIADGTPWDTQLQLVTAKGNEIWVQAKGKAEVNNGKCIRLYGTFQNIDKQKKAEIAFKEITERLAIATKGAGVGIWDYDVVENNLVWDENMYHLYRINKHDFSGVYEAWEASVHPDDIMRCSEEIEMAISGEKEFDTEFRVVWPNGEIRYIRAIAVTQKDRNGRALKMIGTNWDITPLKKTQLELHRSEKSFTGAFENSASGMAIVTPDGKWTKVNSSLCSSLGYTEKELLRLTVQDITHHEDLKRDLKLLKKVLDGKIATYNIEKRYYHKKGHIVYAMLTVSAVFDIRGKLSHFISQIMDISSRIEAEKRLKTLISVTKEQNNNLLNFAHIVSHNLRSHSSNLSMLTGFLKTEKNAQERKNLEGMLSNASDSLNETVQHLNEVVQVKTGALDKLNSTSLKNAVLSVENNISALLKEQNASCETNIPKSLFVNVVPAYLDSILLNLFTNSIKYSKKERRLKLEISAVKKGSNIVLKFKDNGQGIDLDRHGQKIFGMYKTFHKHKDAKGIGLFITKNQIEAMNGKIEVESEVNVGTTFTIYFKEG